MTENDLTYIRKLLDAGVILHPVLELGAGYGGSTSRNLVESAGFAYQGTDIAAGPNVDYIADFESEDCGAGFPEEKFGTVFVLNVLEHVFMPIRVLDNAIDLVRPGGRVVTITPCNWPVHSYPKDCQRLLPDWFDEYARRRPNLKLLEHHFEFIGRGRVENHIRAGERQLPLPWSGKWEAIYNRIVHKVFNTHGRSQWSASHVAIGAIFEKIA